MELEKMQICCQGHVIQHFDIEKVEHRTNILWHNIKQASVFREIEIYSKLTLGITLCMYAMFMHPKSVVEYKRGATHTPPSSLSNESS